MTKVEVFSFQVLLYWMSMTTITKYESVISEVNDVCPVSFCYRSARTKEGPRSSEFVF